MIERVPPRRTAEAVAADEARKQLESDALRENLRRRKAQARAREAEKPPSD